MGSEPRTDGDKISPDGVFIHDQGASAPVRPWAEQGARALHPSTDFPARPISGGPNETGMPVTPAQTSSRANSESQILQLHGYPGGARRSGRTR